MEIDLRVGGRWRYVMDDAQRRRRSPSTAPTGRSSRTSACVSTEVYEGAPLPPEELEANATVNTATFAEEDGRTTLGRC